MKPLITAVLVAVTQLCFGQDTWTTKLDFGGLARTKATSFAIGNTVYVTTGAVQLPNGDPETVDDMYAYDITNNTWAHRLDFMGRLRTGMVSFAINGKGYAGLGFDVFSHGVKTDIWEYDPVGDSWTKKTDLPGAAREGSFVFVINNKAYIGAGQNNAGTKLTELWEYDPAANSWAQKTSLPSTPRIYASAFAIGTDGYAGLGVDKNNNYLNDFWKYDVSADQWTRKADFPVANGAAVGFATSTRGYMGIGGNDSDLYSYYPAQDGWAKETTYPGATLLPNSTCSFINGKAYFLPGTVEAAGKSFYEYTPATDNEITFNTLTVKTVGDPDFDVTATASSGLAVSFTSSNTDVATISGTTVTIVAGGTTIITATQDGDATYDPAAAIKQTLTVSKFSQSITFNALPDKIVTDDPFDLTATTSSGLTVTYTSSNTDVATISGATVTIVGGGTTTITSKQDGNGTYGPATPVEQALTVTKLDQTIAFTAISERLTTDEPFQLSASATSSLAITYTSSNTDVATIAGDMVTIVGAGTTTVTANQPGNNHFNAAVSVPHDLIVSKVDQTITFNPLDAKTFTDPSFDLTATATSGLPLAYTSSDTDVATIDGSTVTILGAGTATITASQAGNNSYNAAVNVDRVLTISPADQTIAVDSITAKVVGGRSFDIPASASSSLALIITADGNEVSIEGNTITPVIAGKVTLKLNQPGNVNYNAAPEVKVSFCVDPRTPKINHIQEGPSEIILTSTIDSGNQWYKDDVAMAGSTSASITVKDVGVYTVQSTIEGCTSEMSGAVPIIVTGDIEVGGTKVAAYPNPATDRVFITLPGGSRNKVTFMNMDGRFSQEYYTESSLLEVDVHHFTPGLYFVRAGETVVKFIKK
jgi:N-acetylneuraminic acid mutarotase